jgi:hypothetical protein
MNKLLFLITATAIVAAGIWLIMHFQAGVGA